MKKIAYFLFSIFFFTTSHAQQPTKEDLQRKNVELSKEIETIRAYLDKAKGDKKATLGLLSQLNRKIEARNQIIQNIKGEVYYIEKDIIKTYREIDTLKNELDTLKIQYAKSIVYAYKNRSNYDFLNFLFSANNFNDALKRIAYLKQYRMYREQQAERIAKTNTILKQKIGSLTNKRQDKNSALQEQSKQMNELEEDKKVKDQALAQIKATEKDLSKTIQNKESQRQQIAKSINQIIQKEIALAKKAEADRQKKIKDSIAKIAAKTPTVNPPNTNPTNNTPIVARPKTTRTFSSLEQTPEGLISSTEFEKNKGNLPWPVDQGVISLKFGNNKIPSKSRDINQISDGITIETPIGAAVKAIFEGDVISIFPVGDKEIIIIRHGKYFTTYSNLSSTAVNKGQKITRGQVIGRASYGQFDSNVGEVELIISTESGNSNPENWIRRR